MIFTNLTNSLDKSIYLIKYLKLKKIKKLSKTFKMNIKINIKI